MIFGYGQLHNNALRNFLFNIFEARKPHHPRYKGYDGPVRPALLITTEYSLYCGVLLAKRRASRKLLIGKRKSILKTQTREKKRTRACTFIFEFTLKVWTN